MPGYASGGRTYDNATEVLNTKIAELKWEKKKTERLENTINDLLHAISEDRPDLVLKYLDHMKIEKKEK